MLHSLPRLFQSGRSRANVNCWKCWSWNVWWVNGRLGAGFGWWLREEEIIKKKHKLKTWSSPNPTLNERVDADKRVENACCLNSVSAEYLFYWFSWFGWLEMRGAGGSWRISPRISFFSQDDQDGWLFSFVVRDYYSLWCWSCWV